MKKISLFLCLILIVSLFSIPAMADNSSADFTLTEEKHMIRGSEILAISGAVANNHAIHATDGNIFAFALPNDPANDGQTLHRFYKGDTITFTVDFGSEGYESFGYHWYGLAGNSGFELYIDDVAVGTAEIAGNIGWIDNEPNKWVYQEIDFGKVYTGVHQIKLEATAPDAWPSNPIGKFIFNKAEVAKGPDFTLTEDKHMIRGSEILAISGAVANNHAIHATDGNIFAFALPNDPANDGQTLHGFYKGDTITFTVDFGSEGYESFGYHWYGLAGNSGFELYIDDVAVGTAEIAGNIGWIDNEPDKWVYQEIDFGKVYTGVHQIKLEATAPDAWPSNPIGKFVFNKIENAVNPGEPADPDTGDNSLFVLLAVVAVSMGRLYFMAISRRKTNV